MKGRITWALLSDDEPLAEWSTGVPTGVPTGVEGLCGWLRFEDSGGTSAELGGEPRGRAGQISGA